MSPNFFLGPPGLRKWHYLLEFPREKVVTHLKIFLWVIQNFWHGRNAWYKKKVQALLEDQCDIVELIIQAFWVFAADSQRLDICLDLDFGLSILIINPAWKVCTLLDGDICRQTLNSCNAETKLDEEVNWHRYLADYLPASIWGQDIYIKTSFYY